MANFILKIPIVFWNSSKSFDIYPSLNDAKTSSGIVLLIILGREKREERLRISVKGLKGGTNLFGELNFSQQALPLQLITRAVDQGRNRNWFFHILAIRLQTNGSGILEVKLVFSGRDRRRRLVVVPHASLLLGHGGWRLTNRLPFRFCRSNLLLAHDDLGAFRYLRRCCRRLVLGSLFHEVLQLAFIASRTKTFQKIWKKRSIFHLWNGMTDPPRESVTTKARREKGFGKVTKSSCRCALIKLTTYSTLFVAAFNDRPLTTTINW